MSDPIDIAVDREGMGVVVSLVEDGVIWNTWAAIEGPMPIHARALIQQADEIERLHAELVRGEHGGLCPWSCSCVRSRDHENKRLKAILERVAKVSTDEIRDLKAQVSILKGELRYAQSATRPLGGQDQ